MREPIEGERFTRKRDGKEVRVTGYRDGKAITQAEGSKRQGLSDPAKMGPRFTPRRG